MTEAPWLAVFAKLPRPGAVKTRMCPPLDWERAAGLYEAMLDDVLKESRLAARRAGFALVVAVDPPGGAAALRHRGPAEARFVDQVGDRLASRMTHLARSALAAGAPALLMRGSDSPALDADTLCAAASRVMPRGDEPAELELGISPDPDGGYNLVALSEQGLRRAVTPPADIFGHAMSTPAVLETTLARADETALRGALLPASFDIDRAEDLRQLLPYREPADRRGAPCPATLAFLDAHGLWPTADSTSRC